MSLVIRGLAVVGAVAILTGVYAMLSAGGFSARVAPSDVEAHIARAIRGATMPNVTRPATAPAGDARGHWASHCAVCHGADGSGATAMGQGMMPRAPDMRAQPTQQLRDGEIYWVIQNGVRFSGMPAWGEPRDDDPETWALVDFIRTLPRLTPVDIAAIARAMPMSEHERHEREAEDAFLRGE